MNSKECFQQTLDFASPGRLPVWGHPSSAGLYVHGEKMLSLLQDFPFDNQVTYREVPRPPAETMCQGEYHEFKRDCFGTEWEYRIFGLHGHPSAYAFADWSEAAVFDFGRLPLPAPVAEDVSGRVVCRGWQTLFETLHAVRPMEEVLIGIALRDPEMLEFLERLTEFRCREIEAYATQHTDVVYFADDWGTQTGTLISPADWNAVFREAYRRMIDCAHRHGQKVLFHSCGLATPIWRELFQLKIDMFWPQIKLIHPHTTLLAEAAEHRVTLLLRPDPQTLMPSGTPEEIEQSIAAFAAHARRQGGGVIFHVELENDVPWPNVQALLRALSDHCLETASITSPPELQLPR